MTRSIIKNTNRTLMIRGMKGCFVYFEDMETKVWFRSNTKWCVSKTFI